MTRRPPRSTGTDTLLPYPTRCRSAAGFEVVDEDGGGGCIGAHFLGEVAQGARFGAQALERAIATEGHAGGFADLAAPVATRFHHQRHQNMPGVFGVGLRCCAHADAPCGCSSRRWATRAALG